ncbi:MAG: antitoxin, family [Gammaproteobacteria bacterium]|jgi:addiction module HigA family antidote|nr:antitoxin, family [Gammaproteobacteria bacterium]
MSKKNLSLVHPGEILIEEFLKPLNISQYCLAKALHVSSIRISEIIRGKRAITADTAIRLGRYFKMEARFWMNLQISYDLEKAMRISNHKICSVVNPRQDAA